MIHEDQKTITTQWPSTMRHFTAAIEAPLNTSCSISKLNYTDERECPQEEKPAWENCSLGLIEIVQQL